uniref:KH domain-containing, RNA-binding, signal transduction-associated protein 2-like isoform X1 n=1 Tax=Myxine glutinosa TaxID=7769 RepID=UPI00358EA202
MATEGQYLSELRLERTGLASNFKHAAKLVTKEMDRVQSGEPPKEEGRKYIDALQGKNMKLTEKVVIPTRQYPKFNFVGKLLGPRGQTLKQLQSTTGARMAIMGRGSMRDRSKEEELRKSGEAKYAHLSEELHVLVEVFSPPSEAYTRMGGAIEELKRFLVPEYEVEGYPAYANGAEEAAAAARGTGRGRAAPPRGRGQPAPPPPTSMVSPRGRAAALPPPPPPGRKPPPPAGRLVTGARHPPPPAYGEYAYEDPYETGYDELGYSSYDAAYSAPAPSSSAEYYDYGHGANVQAYESYEREEWAMAGNRLKAPQHRPGKPAYREHPYDASKR